MEYVYFQNSFFLSMVAFAAWQGVSREWVFLDCPLWLIMLLMIVSLTIILHSALRVMPLYALIQPIGSHCPANVLKIATKQQAKALQTKTDGVRLRKSIASWTGGKAQVPGPKFSTGSFAGYAGHSLAGDLCLTPRKVADHWLANHVGASPERFDPWKEQVTKKAPAKSKLAC